jgi:hypothetical protein
MMTDKPAGSAYDTTFSHIHGRPFFYSTQTNYGQILIATATQNAQKTGSPDRPRIPYSLRGLCAITNGSEPTTVPRARNGSQGPSSKEKRIPLRFVYSRPFSGHRQAHSTNIVVAQSLHMVAIKTLYPKLSQTLQISHGYALRLQT